MRCTPGCAELASAGSGEISRRRQCGADPARRWRLARPRRPRGPHPRRRVTPRPPCWLAALRATERRRREPPAGRRGGVARRSAGVPGGGQRERCPPSPGRAATLESLPSCWRVRVEWRQSGPSAAAIRWRSSRPTVRARATAKPVVVSPLRARASSNAQVAERRRPVDRGARPGRPPT